MDDDGGSEEEDEVGIICVFFHSIFPFLSRPTIYLFTLFKSKYLLAGV